MTLCICVIDIYSINEGVRQDFVTDVIITTVTKLIKYYQIIKIYLAICWHIRICRGFRLHLFTPIYEYPEVIFQGMR